MSFGGGGSKVQAAGPSYQTFMGPLMSAQDPVTTLPDSMKFSSSLPSDYQPTAPQVDAPMTVINNAGGVEGQLASMGLNVDNSNPVFAQTAAQDYAKKYFDYAIQPQLGSAAVAQYMGGNFGNNGDTFGSNYLASLANQGSQSAFFAGQDFRNQEISNLLNRRQSFFGNEVNLAQQQNATDIQRQLALNDETTQRVGQMNDTTTQRLGMLNNYRLGYAGLMSNSMNAAADRSQQANMYNAQQAYQSSAAKAGSLTNLAGGLVGGAFGLGNAYLNRGSSNFGGSSSAFGDNFSIPALGTIHGTIGGY